MLKCKTKHQTTKKSAFWAIQQRRGGSEWQMSKLSRKYILRQTKLFKNLSLYFNCPKYMFTCVVTLPVV